MATFKGLLAEDFGTIQVTDKFRKREFVLDEVTSYNGNERHNPVKFQLTNDNCSKLDGAAKGQEISVEYAPQGNRIEKDGKVSYFINLNCWKADFAQQQAPQSAKGVQESINAQKPLDAGGLDSDLPF